MSNNRQDYAEKEEREVFKERGEKKNLAISNVHVNGRVNGNSSSMTNLE